MHTCTIMSRCARRHTELTEGQYHAVADATMDALHEKIEVCCHFSDTAKLGLMVQCKYRSV